MGLFRSLIGILFILGGIYRVILGFALLFFGSVLSSIDPVGQSFMELQQDTSFLSVIGIGYILLGAFFIWLGNKIRSGGQKTIRI